MNTEEDEFKRIEAEAKRRAARDEDDDTQGYTSEMRQLLAEAYRCGVLAGAAAEREACAKVCELRSTPGTGSVAILNGAATAIRARGNT